MRLPAGTTTSSAWLARLSVKPITSSPTPTPSTPSPIAPPRPGEVAALARRERRRPTTVQQALADLGFARIDARGLHPHANLTGSGLWLVDFHDAQHIDPAVLIEPDRERHCEAS